MYGISGLSLDGWSLVGINGANDSEYRVIDLSGGTIPLDGILVVATSIAAAPLAAVTDFVADVDWENGAPDAIQLRDASDLVIDALAYGGLMAAGEGNSAPDVPAGSSLTRDAFGTDTNDNLTDFTANATPTPGVGPPPIPEPSQALLALLACGVSLMRRTR